MNDRSEGDRIRARPAELLLYGKPGCGLCDEARAVIGDLLARRARQGLEIPLLVERDITTNREWEAAFFLTIPVVEIDGQRLELATSPSRIGRLIAGALDGTATPA